MSQTRDLPTEASQMTKKTHTTVSVPRKATGAVRKVASSGRFTSTPERNRQAAAKVYIKASKKVGEPVPRQVRAIASGE